MTRSFTAMARLDLQGSFAFHPLGPLLFVLTASQIPIRIACLLRPGKLFGCALLQRGALAFEVVAVGLALFGVWRLAAGVLALFDTHITDNQVTTWRTGVGLLAAAILVRIGLSVAARNRR